MELYDKATRSMLGSYLEGKYLSMRYDSSRKRMELRTSPYSKKPDRVRKIASIRKEDVIRILVRLMPDIFNNNDTEVCIESEVICITYNETSDGNFKVTLETSYTKSEVNMFKSHPFEERFSPRASYPDIG